MTAVYAFFCSYCAHSVNTLTFHLLNHHVGDLERFGTVSVLLSSRYDYFSFIVKQTFESASKRLQPSTKDIVNILDINVNRKKVNASTLS